MLGMFDAYREGVAADVVRADGQIGNLEMLDAVHVKALVQDTVLHDAVTILRRHGAGSKRMPCGLAMTLYPLQVSVST